MLAAVGVVADGCALKLLKTHLTSPHGRQMECHKECRVPATLVRHDDRHSPQRRP